MYYCLMRVIILLTFFLVPLCGVASFPIENETTEIINEVYNQNSNTKTPWYLTWWATLLNIILIATPIAFLAAFGLLLRIIRIFVKNKNFWKWFLIIIGSAIFVILTISLIAFSRSGV